MSQSQESTWNNLNKLLTENSINFDQNFITKPSKMSTTDQMICQIICDSGDLKTAISQLLIAILKNFDNGKLNAIYVQESISIEFLNELKVRLGKLPEHNSPLTNKVLLDLMKNFGGEIIVCSNAVHYLTVGIPVSHTQNLQIPISAIEFFRTPKDVLQLIKNDCKHITNFSIWTEKISLAYEIRDNLNAKIVLVNLIQLNDSDLTMERYKYDIYLFNKTEKIRKIP